MSESSQNLTLEEEIILENLSFYEWTNFEKLLIGLNPSDLVIVESIKYGELEKMLLSLNKRSYLEIKIENSDNKEEKFYKRILKKKKGLLSKIFNS